MLLPWGQVTKGRWEVEWRRYIPSRLSGTRSLLKAGGTYSNLEREPPSGPSIHHNYKVTGSMGSKVKAGKKRDPNWNWWLIVIDVGGTCGGGGRWGGGWYTDSQFLYVCLSQAPDLRFFYFFFQESLCSSSLVCVLSKSKFRDWNSDVSVVLTLRKVFLSELLLTWGPVTQLKIYFDKEVEQNEVNFSNKWPQESTDQGADSKINHFTHLSCTCSKKIPKHFANCTYASRFIH